MVTTAMSTIGLVPQKRLGAMLERRRESYGYSIEDMARRSGGQFNARELAGIEAGMLDFDDVQLEALSLLYEFNSTAPIPQRSRLIIAADEGTLPSRDNVDPAQVRLVQIRYLALLYLLRNRPVGEPIALRGDDLAMLAEAFDTGPQAIEATLEELMTDVDALAEQVETLRRRLVVPAAGLLVGPTPAGALVLVK